MTETEVRALDAAATARVWGDTAAVAIARRLANGLSLAATPTFAMLALLTALSGHPMDELGSSGPSMSSGPGMLLTGMLPMYVFMSAFHAPPWLKWLLGHSVRARKLGTHRRRA
jgi:hypothetical protein